MKRQGNAKKMRKLRNTRMGTKNPLQQIMAPDELKSAVKLEQILRAAHEKMVRKDNQRQLVQDKAKQEAKRKRKAQKAKRKKNRGK